MSWFGIFDGITEKTGVSLFDGITKAVGVSIGRVIAAVVMGGKDYFTNDSDTNRYYTDDAKTNKYFWGS